MDWRRKCLAFWLLEYMPGGTALYYYLQRNVTKTLPRQPALLPGYIASAIARRDYLLCGGSPSGKTLLEFGAGWDLFHNIVLYCYGFDRQTVVDINPWMRPELVNSIIEALRRDPPPGAVRSPPSLLGTDAREELQRIYGIDYRAPADARHVDMASNFLDYAATTTTLEHIPFTTLREILQECRRLLKPDGIMCMQIDYSDHFSHADSSITPYNFLQFSENTWRRYNPPKQHQNRRRHSDYGKLFQDLGYRILSEEAFRPPNWKPMLDGIRLHPDFVSYNLEDVAATSGTYVLSPNKGG